MKRNSIQIALLLISIAFIMFLLYMNNALTHQIEERKAHGEKCRRIIHGTGARRVVRSRDTAGAGEESGLCTAVRDRSNAVFPSATDRYDAALGRRSRTRF